MRETSRKSERGQALVLLALGMIALLAFAGLALDGGRAYNERRRAQNAADQAALAAALKAAQGQPYVTEGLAVAAQNDYDNDGATNTVTVNKPPTQGAYAGNTGYVEVIITQDVPTSFIQLVYSGPLRLTVRAVAEATIATTKPLAPGQALVALDPDDCNALQFHGNGTTEIVNGGAFSNSNADPPPASCHSGRATGSSVIISDGGLSLVGDWDSGSACVKDDPGDACGTGIVNTYVDPLDLEDPVYDVDETSLNNLCNSLPNNGTFSQNGGVATINAGRYNSIEAQAGAIVTMNPGLYCITGSDGFDTAGGQITGYGVIIYLQTGPFETNGNATNTLTAPDDTTCTAPPAGTVNVCDFKGLLVYTAESNTSTIKINGGAGSLMSGTFYMPNCPIEITGDSGTFALRSQILGKTVDIGGNGNVQIDFEGGPQFENRLPPQIRLVE